jgi:hypothetical protein
MSSRELQLISRIIKHGEIDRVVEWGIMPEDFRQGLSNSIYNYILAYYAVPESRGSIIGPSASAQFFPNFALCDDPFMTTEALCAEVRKSRIALEASEKLDRIRVEMDADPIGACAKLQQLGSEMLQLGTGKTTDVKLGTAFDQLLTHYQMQQQGVDFSVATMPWHLLQDATNGLAREDYVVIYGRPKSKKSWVLFYWATDLFMQDKRIVIYTKEMTAENVFKRIVACMARIPYYEFRKADLSRDQEAQLYLARKMVYDLRADERIVVLSGRDAPTGGDTVPWLHAKVKLYQPDVCLVDGLYLMSDIHKNKDDHKKVRSISNDLRQMILDLNVPLIATLQANRNAAKHNEANLDEIAFSDAIGQDATIVMRVINEREKNTAMLVLGGAREFTLNGLRINAEPAINFEQYGSTDHDARITAKDIEKAKESDKGESDNAQAHTNGSANGVNKVSNGLRPHTPTEEAKHVNGAISKGIFEHQQHKYQPMFPSKP